MEKFPDNIRKKVLYTDYFRNCVVYASRFGYVNILEYVGKIGFPGSINSEGASSILIDVNPSSSIIFGSEKTIVS
jgi:hypothetical protein